MLSLPYYNFRKQEVEPKNAYDSMPTLKKMGGSVEYPELYQQKLGTHTANLLFDSTLRSEFSEGANFQADPVKEE